MDRLFSRFNQRQDRLYLDVGKDMLDEDVFVIDCYRALDPETFTQVYNDPFVKKYATALSNVNGDRT